MKGRVRSFLTDIQVVEAEDLDEFLPEPVPRSGSVEQTPVPAEGAPGLLRAGTGAAADPQLIQGHAGCVQEPGDVVVRADQQGRRIGEGLVVGYDSGVHVPVRGDDGQGFHGGVEAAGDVSYARISRE